MYGLASVGKRNKPRIWIFQDILMVDSDLHVPARNFAVLAFQSWDTSSMVETPAGNGYTRVLHSFVACANAERLVSIKVSWAR